MGSKLSEHINIGKYAETKLKQVGIDSFEKLKTLGSEQAFLQLQIVDPGVCLSFLYGLEGAIEGVKWHNLSPIKKRALQEFYKMSKKKHK